MVLGVVILSAMRCGLALLACLAASSPRDRIAAERPRAERAEFNRLMELREDGHFVLEPSETKQPVVAEAARAANHSQRVSLQVTPAADGDVHAVPIAAASLLEQHPGPGPTLQQEEEAHRTKVHAREALLQVAQTMSADELAEAERILELALRSPTDEQIPKQMVASRPQHWTMKAWGAYRKAQDLLAKFRGTGGNAIATFAALGLGADSCILKIAFIMYTHVGEDDYPYLPNGCGMGFNYEMPGGAAAARLSGLLLVVLAWVTAGQAAA